MIVAGLTGGLASGKSFIGAAMRELGAHVIEADLLGHEVIAPGGTAHDAVLREFGTVDRQRLGTIVFADPAALERLNQIVHPAVRERAVAEFQQIASHSPRAVIIYVAAILIETGAAKDFDNLIVAACTREQQIERALGRGNLAEAGVLARLNRQLPLDEKKSFADYLIDTSGTVEETLRQTKMVYNELRSLA